MSTPTTTGTVRTFDLRGSNGCLTAPLPDPRSRAFGAQRPDRCPRRPPAPQTRLATFTYHRRRRDRPSRRRGTRFRLRPDTARPAFAGPGPVSSGTLYRGPGRRLPPTETASVRHPGPAFSRARSDGLPPAEAASSLAAAARAAGTTRHVAACADPPDPPAAGRRDDGPGPGTRGREPHPLRPPAAG